MIEDEMAVIAVKSKGQIVIPQAIREEVGLNAGDLLEARVEGGKITLTRKSAVERAIAEGLDDIRKGRVYGPFDTVDQMLASLKGKRRKSLRKPRPAS
jgi:AbrB family looped-hinge helix DNA binding protein